MENRPELDRAKMTQEWRNNGENMENSSKIHFWAIFWPFVPLSSSGQFSIWFSIFSPFPAFRPFSIPYRPDRIPKLQPKQTSAATSLLRLCCRTSVCHSGKGTLDAASRVPS